MTHLRDSKLKIFIDAVVVGVYYTNIDAVMIMILMNLSLLRLRFQAIYVLFCDILPAVARSGTVVEIVRSRVKVG